MENTKKIDVYLDLEFLRLIFNEANKNLFNEKGRLVHSFIDFLEEDHVQLYFADNDEKIDKYNLFQVFLGADFEHFYKYWDLRSKSDYKYNQNYDFETISNPFVFFFGEKYSNIEMTRSDLNIFFTDFSNFLKEWKSVSSNKTIHIKRNQSTDNFWREIFEDEIKWGNLLIIVEPFLSNWDIENTQIERAGTNALKDNIISIIKILENKNKIFLTLFSKINNNQNEEKKSHIQNQLDSINNLNYSVKMFNEKKAKVFNDNNTEKYPVEKIWNYLHDRYIYTNYFVINSAHSWDYIQENRNGDKHIPKNTQITIQSIVKKDVFDFMISKLSNYKELVDLTKEEVFSSIHVTVENINFENKLFNNL